MTDLGVVVTDVELDMVAADGEHECRCDCDWLLHHDPAVPDFDETWPAPLPMVLGTTALVVLVAAALGLLLLF